MVASVEPRHLRTGVSIGRNDERPLVRLSHLLNAFAALAALALFALVAGLALYAFGHQGRIYQGVSVAGVDLSGMTATEARRELEHEFSSYMNSPLQLTYEGQSYGITPNQLGIRLDADASVQQAMAVGREGSIWHRSQVWADGLLGGADLQAAMLPDSTLTDRGLLGLTESVARPAVNASIDLSSETPAIVPEVPGVGYDVGVTRALVLQRVTHRSSEPVAVATTALQPEVTVAILEQTLPSTQTALSNALVVRGVEGRSWTVDQGQLRALVSVSADGTSINVDRAAIEQMVANIAGAIERPAVDAVLFVNGSAEIAMTPGELSVEVDADASVDQIEASLLNGTHDVELVIERHEPPVTDERALAAKDEIEATLANGITIKWDEGEKALTQQDLLAALVIKETSDGDEPFAFSLSPKVLSSFIQTFAGDIEVEPREAQFRLVDGKVRVHQKGRQGMLIDYDSSAERIEKAVFSGYSSSNLKVEVVKPQFSDKDAAGIELPDVLGESYTNYANSSEARKVNIERAVDLLNGWMLAPGQEYSYVNLIGEITEDNGFEVGLGIVADPNNPGAVVTAPVVGGGICQVSTTIYQSAFWAGLPFTERWAHPYWIQTYGQAPTGMKGLDAMVNIETEPSEWATTLDMRFVNTTDNWIAIEMVADGANVTSRVLGTDPEWEVEVTGPEVDEIVKPDPTPIRQDSPEIPAGEERQVETAQDGFDAEINRIVTDKDGNVIDDYTVTSTYSATSNRILVGTGE